MTDERVRDLLLDVPVAPVLGLSAHERAARARDIGVLLGIEMQAAEDGGVFLDHGRADEGLVSAVMSLVERRFPVFVPDLVPALEVSELERSVAFWCGPCGFRTEYRYPGGAHVSRRSAHLALEQRDRHGEKPAGASRAAPAIELRLSVAELSPLVEALRAAGHASAAAATAWRRSGAVEEAQFEELIVTDPDGHVVRFQAWRAHRAAERLSP